MSSELEVRSFIAPGDRRAALEHDVRDGFSSTPKVFSPTWFYDERGSELFEAITELPEYYLTRAETAILSVHAKEIVEIADAEVLVELGSGSSRKTRLLLDAMLATSRLAHFVPFDVSESALVEAAQAINAAYGVPVTAIVGDFSRHLGEIPVVGGRRLIAFLGSTIGNLDRELRFRFLVDLEAGMNHDDWLLLGTDLVKDRSRLLAAYDDADGVTAEFNLNVLAVLNNELGADFVAHHFDHVAAWNDAEQRIEMRLRSKSAHQVEVPALDISIEFAEHEELLTEICSKFTPEAVERELAAANFVVAKTWSDPAGDFLLTLAHPYC